MLCRIFVCFVLWFRWVWKSWRKLLTHLIPKTHLKGLMTSREYTNITSTLFVSTVDSIFNQTLSDNNRNLSESTLLNTFNAYVACLTLERVKRNTRSCLNVFLFQVQVYRTVFSLLFISNFISSDLNLPVIRCNNAKHAAKKEVWNGVKKNISNFKSSNFNKSIQFFM